LIVIDTVTCSRSIDAVEDRLHVGERVDRHSALSDFAVAVVVIGVVAVERRQMKCR
jgi:hypothetical protein